MNLTKPSDVSALLDRLGLRPSKGLGQNFLIDLNVLNIMLRAAALSPRDAVLEVGPGLGVLTEGLLKRAGRVIAVEKDHRLHDFLRERLAHHPALHLVHGDILEQDLEALLKGGVNKVVANLPYSIGTRFLVDVVEAVRHPLDMVVTVQEDVARRLCARPSTRAYGALGIWAQSRYEVSIEKVISPTCFLPAPRVRSAIVVFRRLEEPKYRVADRATFHGLVKTAFLHRRKQLRTILDAAYGQDASAMLGGLQIDPARRPESLSVEEWCRLATEATGRSKPY